MSEAVQLALIASIAPSLAALAGIITGVLLVLRKQEQTHRLINSRMTELLEATAKSSLAQGRQEERHEQQRRDHREERGQYPGLEKEPIP